MGQGAGKQDIKLSVDLVVKTRRFHRHLKQVDGCANLLNENVIRCALRRYELIWLPLVQKRGSKNHGLVPPFDIHFIWCIHMLEPKIYARDCQVVTGKLVSYEFCDKAADENRALGKTETFWKTNYPHEPFYVDLNADWSNIQVPPYESKITYDIEGAIKINADFFYQVSLPYYCDTKFLQKCIVRYKKFMYLKRQHPTTQLTPTYDVDLVWRAHQCHPQAYKKDTEKYMKEAMGRTIIETEDREVKEIPTSEQPDGLTNSMWMDAYEGEYFVMRGTEYRGAKTTILCAEAVMQRVANSTHKFQVILKKINVVGVGDRDSKFYVGLCSMSRRTACLEEVFKIKCPPRQHENATVGLKTFFFNTDDHSHLRIRMLKHHNILQKLKRKMGRPKDDTFAYWDMMFLNAPEITPFQGDLEISKAVELIEPVQDACAARPVNIQVDIGATCRPVTQGPCILQLTSQGITELTQIDVQEWGHALPPSMESYRGDTVILSHELHNHQDKLCYTVRVLMSGELGVAAVQVWDETLRPQAVATLLPLNYLPVRKQIGNARRFMCINEDKKEIAMLIKDAEGDFGVIIGRWVSRQEGQNADSNDSNPGFLHVKYHGLRKQQRSSCNVPTRNKATKFFKFKMKVEDVSMDLQNGRIEIAPTADKFAPNVALAFAIPLMFVLCAKHDICDEKFQNASNAAAAEAGAEANSVSANLYPTLTMSDKTSAIVAKAVEAGETAVPSTNATDASVELATEATETSTSKAPQDGAAGTSPTVSPGGQFRAIPYSEATTSRIGVVASSQSTRKLQDLALIQASGLTQYKYHPQLYCADADHVGPVVNLEWTAESEGDYQNADTCSLRDAGSVCAVQAHLDTSSYTGSKSDEKLENEE